MSFQPSEATRPPQVRTQNFTPTPPPLRPALRTDTGLAAGDRLARDERFNQWFAFARFGAAPMASTRPPLAGAVISTAGPVLRPDALATSVRGSLRQGPRRTLFSSYRTSHHLLFCAHAGRTSSASRLFDPLRGRASRGLDPPCARRVSRIAGDGRTGASGGGSGLRVGAQRPAYDGTAGT